MRSLKNRGRVTKHQGTCLKQVLYLIVLIKMLSSWYFWEVIFFYLRNIFGDKQITNINEKINGAPDFNEIDFSFSL